MTQITDTAALAITNALQRILTDSDHDPVLQIKQLLDALRPPRRRIPEGAPLHWSHLLQCLRDDENLRLALREVMLKLFATRRQVGFYTDSGLLPDTGFFSELHRILMHKILPEVRDTSEFRDCVADLFHRRSDQLWIAAIPDSERRELWTVLDLHGSDDVHSIGFMVEEMLNASIVLSHRVAAMGLLPELSRVYPRLRQAESPFVAMNTELVKFVEAFRAALSGKGEMDDGGHLFVLLEQCEDTVQKIHASSSRLGTSMALSFTLTRMTQHLERLTLLLRFMTTKVQADTRDDLTARWSDFLMSAMEGERNHNSLRKLFSNLLSILALRITDNAAHTGEHYIANTRAEWFSMLWRAAGAGALIALLAFLKIQSKSLHLEPLAQSWLNAGMYASGFAVIYMLNFVIATKQPAMTAATLAGKLSHVTGRLRDSEKIVDLMVDTFRSQLAAVTGNIMLAFPFAIFIVLTLQPGSEQVLVEPTQAYLFLHDLRPVASPALLYAAVAGVWLFMAGLFSGYLDNRAIYMQLGPRLGQLPWLRFVFGSNNAQAIGDYLVRHAGGLGGNIFFGLMLGLTPALASWFGLTLDIRHIAFSAANVGYAVVALKFAVPQHLLIAAIAGVLLVGLVNLSVSFALALWVAMRSRRLSFWLLAPVMPRLFHRLLEQPRSFFLPPPRSTVGESN